MEHKLELVEQAKVEYFLTAYNELHTALDQVTLEIDRLNTEKNKIIERVDLVRQQDKEFNSTLNSKYGPGAICVETMTYKTD